MREWPTDAKLSMSGWPPFSRYLLPLIPSRSEAWGSGRGRRDSGVETREIAHQSASSINSRSWRNRDTRRTTSACPTSSHSSLVGRFASHRSTASFSSRFSCVCTRPGAADESCGGAAPSVDHRQRSRKTDLFGLLTGRQQRSSLQLRCRTCPQLGGTLKMGRARRLRVGSYAFLVLAALLTLLAIGGSGASALPQGFQENHASVHDPREPDRD
jgi:hypothetical protein